ncbi:NblA/ycf18 family protein [Oscillatoria sp. FACHB-1407]|uniref:NblA/ycf18 family protein n=1 Tax=Oscillatoria sp. FACHB-1407 TaxID=2692847 RepID=UPI0016853080|nr:NblA/ycf18 family protein [Oscillatoria sp. FACHB-1407]MBD2460716.1 NblA/ycf18 family protein [Oscillatoria sp. FACHB-1407]
MEPTAFELTLEQQFEMRRMQDEVKGLSHEQALNLLVQASRLLMLKDNIIRNLVSNTPIQSLS